MAGSSEAVAGCPATSTSICHEPQKMSQTSLVQANVNIRTIWYAFFFFFSYTTIQNRFVALIISFPSSWGWRHPSGAVSRFWEDYLSPPLTPLTIIYLRKRKNPWVEILEGGVSWEVSSSASIKPKTCHLFCQGSLALKPLQVLKQEVLLQGKVQGVRTATL